MLPEKLLEVRQWLLKAEHDLLLAERAIHGNPPLPDGAAFHCQQAAEKALKAYLVWHDKPLRKTHDLRDLVQSCEQIDNEFVALRGAAGTLTPYAVTFRYPDSSVLEPSVHEAEEALRLARYVMSFVLDRLPPEAK